MYFRFPILLLALLFGWKGPVQASDVEYYEKHIRPLLVKHCYECHGGTKGKTKGGLDLSSASGWLLGGDSGPTLQPGSPEKSLIWKAVSYEDSDLTMPPGGKLPARELEKLKSWILAGAPAPADVPLSSRSSQSANLPGKDHWAFQPLSPEAPPSHPSFQGAEPLDRYVLARLKEAGLSPAPAASPEARLRRLHLDLIGMPPTRESLDAFLKDPSEAAWHQTVEDLLSSRAYGERWGRHWLDVARYADSSGGGRTRIFDQAWRYRDYVVEAFQQDLPLSQFIREQIAGDLMEWETDEERARAWTATSFLALGPINYELQDKELLDLEVADEQLDTVGKAFLGLSLGCARCHDHKFDPVSNRDYYALAGIFMASQTLNHANVSQSVFRSLPESPEAARERTQFENRKKRLEADLKKAEAELQSIKGGTQQASPENLPGALLVSEDEAEVRGTWQPSTYSNRYVGDHYLHDGNSNKGESSLTYTVRPEVPGWYDLFLAWTPASNRSTRTPVVLQLPGHLQKWTLNQREEPETLGRFTRLGRFYVDAGWPSTLTVSNQDTDGVVVADAWVLVPVQPDSPASPRSPDAIRNALSLSDEEVDQPALIPFIVPDPTELPGIVQDDSEAELIGNWQPSHHTPPFLGHGYLHDGKSDKGRKSATFRPNLPHAGWYEVRLAHCSNIRRTTNAPVTIRHLNGETTVLVNEQAPARVNRLFTPLGRFEFPAGKTSWLRIETSGTDGKYVIVDGVQWLPVEGPDSPDSAGLAPMMVASTSRKSSLEDLKKAEKAVTVAKSALKTLEKKAPPPGPSVMSLRDKEQPVDFHICIRGDIHNAGETVPRGFPKWLGGRTGIQVPEGTSGRLQLADWLADPSHPLVPRVWVNRVWSHLFGTGLVATPDNFGTTGSLPTHPELLDWLVAEFLRMGGSTKALIRTIVLSDTYQRSTHPVSDLSVRDPDNRLLSAFPRKRLDAEVLRDTMLVLVGEGHSPDGGPSVKPGTKSEFAYPYDESRRSLYLPVFRNSLHDFLGAFDVADANLVSGMRTPSTRSQQALYLLNSPFPKTQAAKLAEQLRILQPKAPLKNLLREAVWRVLGRAPLEAEERLIGQLTSSEPSELLLADWIHGLFCSLDYRFSP